MFAKITYYDQKEGSASNHVPQWLQLPSQQFFGGSFCFQCPFHAGIGDTKWYTSLKGMMTCLTILGPIQEHENF